MNLETSFKRKVSYITGIVLLLFPLFYLGQPATSDTDGGRGEWVVQFGRRSVHVGKGLVVEVRAMKLGVSRMGVGERCPRKRVGRGVRVRACGAVEVAKS